MKQKYSLKYILDLTLSSQYLKIIDKYLESNILNEKVGVLFCQIKKTNRISIIN